MTERDGGPPAEDGCWFDGSPYPRYFGLSGGSWVVGSLGHNKYGPDEIGYTTDLVDYYQTQRASMGLSMPCGITRLQNMVIQCNGGTEVFYKQNVLVAQMEYTTVTAIRDGRSATRAWP